MHPYYYLNTCMSAGTRVFGCLNVGTWVCLTLRAFGGVFNSTAFILYIYHYVPQTPCQSMPICYSRRFQGCLRQPASQQFQVPELVDWVPRFSFDSTDQAGFHCRGLSDRKAFHPVESWGTLKWMLAWACEPTCPCSGLRRRPFGSLWVMLSASVC